ncbi:MAG: hypothetical protein AB1816_05680 [Bacillota bacterium]
MGRSGRPLGVGPVVLILGLAVSLAGAAAWWLWPAADYVFLVVDEANGLPPWGWSGTEVEAAAWYDGEGSLRVARGVVRPWHRVVCLHEVDAAGVRVASRLITARRFPARVVLDGPVPGLGMTARVLAGPLEVLGLGPDGHLRLCYGGQSFELAPGQSWAQLRVRGPDGERWFSPGEASAWEATLEGALSAGHAVTRLVITYHGKWPRSGITPPGEALPDRPLGRRA